MRKKRVIRTVMLLCILLIAVLGFCYFTNRENKDISAETDSAELPVLSFTTEGQEVNTLRGYVSDMEITSMRDTITPVKEEELTLHINASKQEIEKVSWQVYTIDGKECVQKGTVDGNPEELTLEFLKNGMLNREKVLKITLHLAKEDVYYYTRIVDSEDCNYDKCLEFANFFHTNTIQGTKKESLVKYLNKKSTDQSKGFQRVTLNSGLEKITWGKMNPEVQGTVDWEIKECNETYTSLLLSYKVKALDTQYDVEEFYRIRIYGDDKIYLMDFVREMQQSFSEERNPLSNSGINLGIVSEVEYKNSSDGNQVAFVQNDELWHYDKIKGEFSLLFSFSDADQRNRYNRHDLHISSLDEHGNVLFYVVGYMNSGAHEGKTGVGIYYFDHEKYSTEEQAFLPSSKGYEIMREELGKFVHYSKTQDILYVMLDGCLYQVNVKEDTKEILVRGLAEGQYMVSEDGTRLVYQNTFGGSERAEQIKILNLETGDGYSVNAEAGDYVKPIGFIREDLIYGFVNSEEEGMMDTGESILPIYKIEIVDKNQKLIKEYRPEGMWIKEVAVEENVVEIKRIIKSDGKYQDTSTDYITSNESMEIKKIQLTTSYEEKRGQIARLKFADGISNLDVHVLQPKWMIQKHPTEVRLDEAKMQGKYYVYALGHLQKTFDNAGEAIIYANELQGVAVSSKQRYIFVRGNWPNAYEIPGIDAFQMKETETAMEACLRKILLKEGIEIDVAVAMEEMSPKQILDQYSGGEGLELEGCTMEQLQYLLSKDRAVIALIEENHPVLLTGYNKTNIAYMDPVEGKRVIVTKDKMEAMLSEQGNVLIGYTK